MLSIIYFFLGASFGSFIGLICDRFPEKSIIFPRSHCSHCKHQLHFFEIIPILSQLFLRSRCRSCQTSIPLRYLFMELFCGVISLLYFYDFLSLEVTYFLYFSLCLSIFDLKHKSYPLLIWIVGTVPLLFTSNYYLTFAFGIILAILSYMKHLNIGEGDFLYLASASLIFPFSKILLIIEIACLLGLAYFLLQRNLKECIAFVPFLFLGVVLLIFYSIV
ncbi:prepilin peptidase [Streptococcus salivarius]